MRSFPFVFILLDILTPIPCIPNLIPRIPTLIPRIPTLIPCIPTLILHIPIIPLIPFPDSPSQLLQIARQIKEIHYKDTLSTLYPDVLVNS